MHAALITGRETVEMVEVPDPEPMAGGAVVDIDLCGICGTDIHAWQSGDPYNPAICGHEWTGVVSAVAADVKAFSEGDRVVCAVPPACGRCDACAAGQTTWCQSTFLVAVGRDRHAQSHGGFAPRIAAHQSRLVHANPGLTIEQAAQVEPATVGFHAVRHTQPVLGDVTVVQGAGPIGLVTLQAVVAGGAGEVIVVEPNEDRRTLASELGATSAVVIDRSGRKRLSATTVFHTSPDQTIVVRSRADVTSSIGLQSWTRITPSGELCRSRLATSRRVWSHQ